MGGRREGGRPPLSLSPRPQIRSGSNMEGHGPCSQWAWFPVWSYMYLPPPASRSLPIKSGPQRVQHVWVRKVRGPQKHLLASLWGCAIAPRHLHLMPTHPACPQEPVLCPGQCLVSGSPCPVSPECPGILPPPLCVHPLSTLPLTMATDPGVSRCSLLQPKELGSHLAIPLLRNPT